MMNPHFRGILLFVGLLASPLAQAASHIEQVLVGDNAVVISEDRRRPWKNGEPVCFLRKSKVLACGKITSDTQGGFRATLTAIESLVKVGDRAVPHDGRRLASAPLNLETEVQRPRYTYDLLAGLTMGLDRVFPKLEWQGYITPHLNFGFQATFSTASPEAGSDSLLALGAMFTVNYYTKKYYRGLWLQGASGVMFIKTDIAGVSVTERSPALSALIGYREDWGIGLNIGIGVGVRYMDFPTTTVQALNVSSFAPVIVADIGFNY